LQHDRVLPSTLYESVTLLAGTVQGGLLLVLAGLAAIGGWASVRLSSRYIWIALLCCAIEVLAITLLRPTAVSIPIVFTRYVASVLPVCLLAIALGATAVDGAIRRRLRAWPYLVSTLLVVALVVLGPLPQIYYRPNNFTNHLSLEADYRPNGYFERFQPAAISDFYGYLAVQPKESLTLVEAPWYYHWHSYAYYQRLHRQRVIVGGVDRGVRSVRVGEVPLDERFAFRNIVNVGDYATLARRQIDYVIFHTNLVAENRTVFQDAFLDMSDWIAEYSILFGPPTYRDSWIVVFDVRRSTLPSVIPR
jgi:hypothetical protein